MLTCPLPPAYLLLLLAAFPLAAAPSPTTTESFDSLPTNHPPAGWTTSTTGEGQSKWIVQYDPAAPSSPHVLLQSATLPKPSFPLCLKDTPALTNGFVEVRFKTISGSIDQAAGVVFRAQDSSNYYICRANALEDNIVLYKVHNGKRTALNLVGRQEGYGLNTKIAPAQWHTLRVDFTGSRFKVTVNSQFLFEVEDATFTSAGKIGLWTKADSVTAFDDFRHGTP